VAQDHVPEIELEGRPPVGDLQVGISEAELPVPGGDLRLSMLQIYLGLCH
jgi:hypothetical protein